LGINLIGIRYESFTAMTTKIYGVCAVYLMGTNCSQKAATSMFRGEVKGGGGAGVLIKDRHKSGAVRELVRLL
jgi:hypothetical protein